jgi:predicted permease
LTASSPSDPVDIWLPLDVDPSEAARNNHVWRAIGRLTPTADVDDANVELLRLSARLPALFPEAYSTDFMERFGFYAVATPLHEDVVGSTSSTLWIVFGSVGLLLVVACFNTANLVLARAQRRRRELAIRSALGASASTLVGRLLMESLVLAAAAGVMAIPLAAWATRLLVAGAPSGIPRMNEVALDLPSVGFMLSLCLTAGLVFGLVPARRATRTEVLGEAGRGLTTSRTHHRVRRALVIGQLAVSLVLLSGASLLWQSFRSLTAVEIGLDAGSVLTFRVILPSDAYGSYEAAGDFYRRATEQISALPGVARVGTTSQLPLDGHGGCSAVYLEGDEIRPDASPPCVPVITVSPGYFEAMGIPVPARPRPGPTLLSDGSLPSPARHSPRASGRARTLWVKASRASAPPWFP